MNTVQEVEQLKFVPEEGSPKFFRLEGTNKTFVVDYYCSESKTLVYYLLKCYYPGYKSTRRLNFAKNVAFVDGCYTGEKIKRPEYAKLKKAALEVAQLRQEVSGWSHQKLQSYQDWLPQETPTYLMVFLDKEIERLKGEAENRRDPITLRITYSVETSLWSDDAGNTVDVQLFLDLSWIELLHDFKIYAKLGDRWYSADAKYSGESVESGKNVLALRDSHPPFKGAPYEPLSVDRW